MRKKGLIERIVMGEAAKEDFSSSQLPKNRTELFSYMIKHKLFKIYKNHLLIALFFIPLIVWGILTMEYTDTVFSADPKVGITYLVEYWVTVYVTAIPMWMLAFVGLAGGLNVIRKLAWGDPVILKTDFLQGIKASGKQMALVGALWGISFALIRYGIDWLGFYYQVFDDSYSVVFGIFLCYFLLVAIIGITVYMACMCSIYNVNFKQLVIGAFKLYFADCFMATGIILLSLLPILILMLIGLAITTLIAYLLVLFALLGIMIIPMFLVCQHTFDRIINKKDYPDYYGRGLSYGAKENRENDVIICAEELENATKKVEIETDFERVSDE